ncbi:MAG: biotin--[acetyl-CoA-carboxylase] ligase [Actinobacteria bacterium RBG_16_68_21]|nr:MAG: biotin--[acetyl-CoA-carboxylase] ligase [Actinobacteria bacterium RBG_16_68_21]
MATPPIFVHLQTVSSTQDEARSRLLDAPVLVTAARQTAGRGRGGSVWETADRAIAASVAFRPPWPEAAWPLVPAVAGLAALDVLGDGCLLKWPNDVILGGSKVAGILVESSGAVVVAGIGVNLWWPTPIPGAGAICPDDPGPERGRRLAEDWARLLLERIEAGPEDWGRDEYLARSATVGSAVTWEPDGAGRAVGIGPLGGLIVQTARGTVVLDSGIVRLVRTEGAGSASG